MPDQRAAPVLQEADLQAEELKLGGQSIDDAYALAIVNQTFFHYEPWRRNNHDNRWQLNDMLYFGQVERKVWEGTNVPRAALSQPIVFDQIEAALPAVKQALFGFEDWFEVVAGPGATAKEARNISEHLKYICEHAVDEFGKTCLTEIGFAIKNILHYGNGGVFLEYDETLKHPTIQWVDIRDIYIDPGTPTPSLDDSKSIIHRRMMTVEDIKKLKANEKMNIPDDAVLYNMASNHIQASADLSKQVSEMMRRVQFNPGFHDDLPLPADKMLEVLVYWSKSRVIWVLNREWVAYNEKNPYGFIPYCFAPCYNVTGRFYGMSIPDVIGDAQLYIQSLTNLHLDELNLNIMPPRVRKRGSLLTPSQLKWRPGQLTESEDPKNDMIVQFTNNATANVSDEVARIEIAAEKRTGVNSMGSGVPRPSNANRTMGGMQMQAQGSASRLKTIVEHIEDYLIVPMLYKLYRMTQVHSTPDKKLPTFTGNEVGEVDALDFFSPVRFTMKASSRMMTRETLQQVFPYLTQYLFQGPFLQEIVKTGYTLDYMELLQMLQDATGISKRYDIIRPMNEQEKQAMAQPDPKTAAELQRAQMDQQTRLQMGQMSQEKDLKIAQLEYDAKIHESEAKSSRELVKLMMEQQGQQYEIAGQKAKLQIELEGMVKKMDLEQQKALMGFLQSKQDHEQKLRQQQEQAIVDHRTRVMDAESQSQAQKVLGEQKLSQAEQMQQQKMAHTELGARQKFMHAEGQNKQKLESQKALMALGLRSKAGTSNENKTKRSRGGK